jgi:hypothetical protein
MKKHENANFVVWDQRVAGSNPATPTKEIQGVKQCLAPFYFVLFSNNLQTVL